MPLDKVLERLIESKITDSRSRADIVSSMASAAKISESTVSQIIRMEIMCPPVQRLRGFAQALGVSASRIISAAEEDGCKYDGENLVACPQWSNDTGEKYLLEAMPRRANQFRKDAIREGQFINVNTKKPLPITRERLEKWANGFARMRANGVNVPIAEGHNTSKPLGSISNMMVVDDPDGKARLWCDYDFADDDAVKAAKRARFVSIGTAPAYEDCEGNQYGEVIQHVAITPTPVITKQADYVQLSLSIDNENPEEDMKEKLTKMADALSLSIGDDTTEEAAFEQIMEKVTELSKRPEAVEEKPEEKEPVKLSREAVEALAACGENKLHSLVQAGKITPAVSKSLKLALIGQDLDNVNALTLTRGEAEKSLLNVVVDILDENDPVELGKKAEKQILKEGERLSKEGEVSEEDKLELGRKATEDDMKNRLPGAEKKK